MNGSVVTQRIKQWLHFPAKKQLQFLRSRLAFAGYISIGLRFIPYIQDTVETFFFVKDYWMAIIEFLGTGIGTLVTLGVGSILVAVAAIWANRPNHPEFPDELTAKFRDADVSLNGVEDHLSFRFWVDNGSQYDLYLNGENRGHMVFCSAQLGQFMWSYELMWPWEVIAVSQHQKIETNTSTEIVITRILDLNLGAEFAYHDPQLTDSPNQSSLAFDFSQMRIGFVGHGKYANRKGYIRLPGQTQVRVPEQPNLWAQYRQRYKLLRGKSFN